MKLHKPIIVKQFKEYSNLSKSTRPLRQMFWQTVLSSENIREKNTPKEFKAHVRLEL